MSEYALPAKVDLTSVVTITSELVGLIQQHTSPTFTIDASALATLDSSVAALLLEAQRAAKKKSLVLQLKSVSQALSDIMVLYGLGDVFSTASSETSH